MKISIKGYITHKGTEEYSDCADNYAFNEDYLRFAISDGVSKSFFPKIWSTILVNNYASKDHWKEDEFVSKCQIDWQLKIDDIMKQPNLMYYTKNAYHNKVPALATFVGLQIFPKKKKWSCQAIGDSFLFFVSNNIKSFEDEIECISSKKLSSEFDNFPDYLSSIGSNHKGEPIRVKNRELLDGTFYLMTDALAEWFIKQKENAVHKIEVWRDQQDFERFIADARESKEISDDDSAILCVELSEVGKDGIEYKNIQVTDLNDLITDQEAEKEKIKLKKLEEEKSKQEKEAEIQKSKEQETSQNESSTAETLANITFEEPVKERFISKSINAVKSFLTGKENEEEENHQIELPEGKTNLELENIEKPTLEQEIPTYKEQGDSETIEADNQNFEKDQNEKLEAEKIEEEAKSEKKESEKLELKEEPKVDPKAKSIIDRFEKL